MKKPHLTLSAARLFFAMVDYANAYRLRSSDLPHAASDVMDGRYWQRDPEVIELTRKGIIRAVGRDGPIDGGGRTWELTPRGCQLIRPQGTMR